MKTKKRNVKYHIDSHHHGLFVKEARLRQGYRLAEVAKDICDVSYLSKIESGTLTPSLDVFEKITKKLSIQFPAIERVCPKEVFRKALYEENMAIIRSFVAVETCHHYEIQLIDFFQAVLEDDLTKATVLKKSIDRFGHHFNSKEEQIYLLFSGMYFFKKFDWETGETCFKRSLALTAQIGEEDPYLYLQLAKYYFQLQKGFLGFSYLKQATEAFKKIFEKAWVFKCDVLWFKEAIKHGDMKNVEAKLEGLRKMIEPAENPLQWSSFFNILALVYEKQKKYMQAEECYYRSMELGGKNVEESHIIDTIKFHNTRQNHQQLIKLIEKLEMLDLSAHGRMLVDFYYFKATEPTSVYFEKFLKQDALPFALKGRDYEHVGLYTEELISYYRFKSSYKKVVDAYDMWKQFCMQLKKIEKI